MSVSSICQLAHYMHKPRTGREDMGGGVGPGGGASRDEDMHISA